MAADLWNCCSGCSSGFGNSMAAELQIRRAHEYVPYLCGNKLFQSIEYIARQLKDMNRLIYTSRKSCAEHGAVSQLSKHGSVKLQLCILSLTQKSF